MEPKKINIDDFKIDEFIEYYTSNIEDLLSDEAEVKHTISLIDKDYLDVIDFDEDYEDFESNKDYIKAFLNEDYSLAFLIGRTYENCEKVEFIDGKKYNLTHYTHDLYEDEDTIKDIGNLSINLDHLIGLLVDFENDEVEISVINYTINQRSSIEVIEDSGDFEDIIDGFINKFTIN